MARIKNFVDNALKATDECKHVAISMQNISDRERCSFRDGGRTEDLKACSSGGDRVSVRAGGWTATTVATTGALPGVAAGPTWNCAEEMLLCSLGL